tara:strand:- start:9230 stop:9478 length:249 start_codon:yes stop_codon:yes gene_type:complete
MGNMKQWSAHAEQMVGSEEVTLTNWKLAQPQDAWEESMMRATLCGVSTRSIPSLRERESRSRSHGFGRRSRPLWLSNYKTAI